MTKKFYRGPVIKTETGAVQFIRNNERKKDFLLITGKHGDLYVPVKAIRKALESEWDADNEERSVRYRDRQGNLTQNGLMNLSECDCDWFEIKSSCRRCV
jgi:hypothetical protein